MNDKPAAKASTPKTSLIKGSLSKATPTPAGGTPAADRPSPPKLVLYTAVALVLSGVFAVISAATLFGGATDQPNGWYYKTAKKANDKLAGTNGKHKKNYIDPAKLHDHIASVPKQLFITSVVVLLAVTVLAVSAYRGKFWARWTTLGLWIMATLTGSLAGISSLLLVTAPGIAASFKIPAFLSALSFVLAVVFVNLRPSIEFFKANKPVRAGAAAARRPPRGAACSRPARRSRRVHARHRRSAGTATDDATARARPDRAKVQGPRQLRGRRPRRRTGPRPRQGQQVPPDRGLTCPPHSSPAPPPGSAPSSPPSSRPRATTSSSSPATSPGSTPPATALSDRFGVAVETLSADLATDDGCAAVSERHRQAATSTCSSTTPASARTRTSARATSTARRPSSTSTCGPSCGSATPRSGR